MARPEIYPLENTHAHTNILYNLLICGGFKCLKKEIEIAGLHLINWFHIWTGKLPEKPTQF